MPRALRLTASEAKTWADFAKKANWENADKLSKAAKDLAKEEQPEEILAKQLAEAGVKGYEREFYFATSINRKWRFDFSWPQRLIAVEIEGGTWKPGGGRHNRGAGFEQDCIKYNTATRMGWKVYRFTSSMVVSGQAVDFIQGILKEA